MKNHANLLIMLIMVLTIFACEEKDKGADSSTFTDARDGKTYKLVKIGEQVWMAENLNYNPNKGESWCYDNKPANCEKYGRLYDLKAARYVCHKGWHLPSKEDWDKLFIYAGGTGVAGKKLKSKNGWFVGYEYTSDANDNIDSLFISGNGTNDYEFSALPGGILRFGSSTSQGDFESVGKQGYWWSITPFMEPNWAYDLRIDSNVDDVSIHYGTEIEGRSVRCVKD